jgi:hypothetical protein
MSFYIISTIKPMAEPAIELQVKILSTRTVAIFEACPPSQLYSCIFWQNIQISILKKQISSKSKSTKSQIRGGILEFKSLITLRKVENKFCH